MIRQSNSSECGHGFGKVPAALPLVLLFLSWAAATGGSALGQEAPENTPTGVELAARHHQDKQFPEMIAVLDKVWKSGPESILKDALRVGNFYGDANQTDALVQHIEALHADPLLERYGDRLGQFAAHFSHRPDQAEAASRVYAAIMKVTPIRSRCELALQYGHFLMRQSRLPEAYEVYKLGFFPTAPDAGGGAYTVPNQRYATAFVTGDVLSPIIALADLAVDMEVADRLRAEVSEAIEDMPKWKPGGDLLLAMLSRREGNEQPIADLGSRCINDPAYRARMAKLTGVLRQELSRCDGAGPLGVVESLWRELEEKGDDLEVVTALHQQALIKMRLDESEQARRFWLRIVDPQRDAKLTDVNLIYWRTFAAEQLKAHGFLVDALQLIRKILETDPSDLPERTSVRNLIEMVESVLGDALRDALAGNFEIAPADEVQIQELLLRLLLGEIAQGAPESDWRLREETVVAIAETMVALGKGSGTLTRLRQDWDVHSMAESLNLLAVRAEAAMTNGDSGAAEKLLARITEIEQSSGRTAPLWSNVCLFHGLHERFKVEFRADLCGGELDKRVFGIAGNVKEHVRSGRDGLVFSAPPDTRALAIGFRPVLRGDFEVTASYAIPKATPPDQINGCGATLRVASKNDERELAGFFAVNGLEADQGGQYLMNRGRLEDGKREVRSERVATSSRSGRLRLIRKGATLHFLAVEDDRSEFRRLHHVQFTADDTPSTRLGVQALDPNVGMEIRWKDLVVRAEEIIGIEGGQVAAMGGEPRAATSGEVQSPEPAQTIQQTPERKRRIWWLVVVFVVSLSTAGLWWMARAKKARSD